MWQGTGMAGGMCGRVGSMHDGGMHGGGHAW